MQVIFKLGSNEDYDVISFENGRYCDYLNTDATLSWISDIILDKYGVELDKDRLYLLDDYDNLFYLVDIEDSEYDIKDSTSIIHLNGVTYICSDEYYSHE